MQGFLQSQLVSTSAPNTMRAWIISHAGLLLGMGRRKSATAQGLVERKDLVFFTPQPITSGASHQDGKRH